MEDNAMTTISKPSTRPAISLPKLLLHLEGLTALIVAVGLYAQQGFSWWVFALLLLAPDLAMLGYLINLRAGSIVYNLLHTYALPLGLAAISFGAGWPLGLQLALIWLAHIGMDRTVGYGLKYPTHFKDTHLARV
jgi:hypothetical protein